MRKFDFDPTTEEVMNAMAIFVMALCSTLPHPLRKRISLEIQTVARRLEQDGQPRIGMLCTSLAEVMDLAPKPNPPA